MKCRRCSSSCCSCPGARLIKQFGKFKAAVPGDLPALAENQGLLQHLVFDIRGRSLKLVLFERIVDGAEIVL